MKLKIHIKHLFFSFLVAMVSQKSQAQLFDLNSPSGCKLISVARASGVPEDVISQFSDMRLTMGTPGVGRYLKKMLTGENLAPQEVNYLVAGMKKVIEAMPIPGAPLVISDIGCSLSDGACLQWKGQDASMTPAIPPASSLYTRRRGVDVPPLFIDLSLTQDTSDDSLLGENGDVVSVASIVTPREDTTPLKSIMRRPGSASKPRVTWKDD